MKARKILKYTAAGAATGIYTLAIVADRRDDDPPKPEPEKVYVAAGILIALTWAAALL